MNILQLISGVDVNGALVYCKLLSERLQARGHQITLAARPGSWILDQNLNLPILTSSMQRFPLDELRRFRAVLKDRKIDLIHTHMSRASHFGVCLNLLTGIPVVATAHSRQWQLHWRFNTHVIANSQATRDYMRHVNGVPAHRLSTVYCFVDLDRFLNVDPSCRDYYRRELHVSANQFLVGVVGDVTERKGHQVLFRALPDLVREIPNLSIALIGRFHRHDSYARKLRGMIKRQKNFCRVKWLGIRQNVQQYLPALDTLCVPSLEEPLGMVAIEGQAAGVPLAVSDTGGLSEIVRDGETGTLFEPNNPDAILEALVNLYRRRERAAMMAKQAQHEVVSRFSPRKLTEQVECVYELVLANRHRRAAA